MTSMYDAEHEATPALFLHCEAVYEAMFKKSTKVGDSMVYEGFLTKLITQDLRLSVPYYTSITAALKQMGCIKQLRRGGSTTESQWELGPAPDLQAYRELVADRDADGVTKPRRGTQNAMLKQQISDLQLRTSRIEEVLGL